MHYFPISLDISGRLCILIGGGQVAERKAKSLMEYGADLVIISPDLTQGLVSLVDCGSCRWLQRRYEDGDLEGAFLVVAATDDVEVQEAVFKEAEKKNILLNVADVPRWCNFILPATVRRGDLTISISTGGKSPALARQLRKDLEKLFGNEYAELLDLLGKVREVVLKQGNPHEENKLVFKAILDEEVVDWVRKREWEKIEKHVEAVIGQPFKVSME